MSSPYAPSPPMPQNTSDAFSSGSTSRPAIVIATRDPAIGRMIAMALRFEGYASQVYADGELALGALLATPCAAAVLDARLTKVDGPTLCQRVQATPSVASIPIILLVMRDEPVLQARGRRMGANAFLFLPFAIEELLATIAAVIALVPTSPSLNGRVDE